MDTETHVTMATSFLVRAGREDAFESWVDRYCDAARASPGHLAVMRLDQAGGLVHLVHRFAGRAEVDRWEASPEHERLVKEADAFAVHRSERGRGGQTRFHLPSEAAAPKWKTWLATWVAVFPVLLALNTAVRALGPDLPPPVQLAITSPILTALLTWAILPQVRRVLRPWLLAGDEGELRKRG
jgi:uncharacterized protein